MTYTILSKHRSKIMALALLWIALFHSTCWFKQKSIAFIQNNGFGGVDIFLFLFSLGLFYSLKKGKNLCQFYIDRIKRILPYVLPALIFACFVYQYDFYKSILFVHFLDLFASGNTTLWYISALPIFVLIAPLYMKIYEKKYYLGILFSIWISVLSFLYFKNSTPMIFASRFPIYFLGFSFGEWSYNDKKIEKQHVLFIIGIMILGAYSLYYNYHHFGSLMWSYGLYWYPFLLITPGLCLIFASFFEYFNSNRLLHIINPLLDKLGLYTLEFYLFHEIIIRYVDPKIYIHWDYYGYAKNFISFLITIAISILYQMLIKKIFHKK